jgi:hypothetical protein
MPRPRQRVCLEQGLKLNLHRLKLLDFVRPGSRTGPNLIRWTSSYTGEEIASGLITANMEGSHEGWLRIQLGKLDQWIILAPRPCHFGGQQWYFICPVMNRRVSILWKPPGASRFCSRQTWGRQVAYASQFLDRENRAHRGKGKIKSRLIGDLDPDEWEFPPKPKWMRWPTYSRYEQKFDAYEGILDQGCAELVAKFKNEEAGSGPLLRVTASDLGQHPSRKRGLDLSGRAG